jgi:hypothetical protein
MGALKVTVEEELLGDFDVRFAGTCSFRKNDLVT